MNTYYNIFNIDYEEDIIEKSLSEFILKYMLIYILEKYNKTDIKKKTILIIKWIYRNN
jgi:hypothetical protein